MSDEVEAGFLLPVNVPGQAESREALARLEGLLDARRARPEPSLAVPSAEPVEWEAFWRDLMEERTEKGRRRWDWRKALYIAWHCVPTSKRFPKHKYELMDLLGVNDATARKWRQNDPEIDERIASGPKQLLGDHVANVLEALVTVASKPEAQSHQDRKLFLEMTGQYRPKGEVALDVEMDGEVGVKHEIDQAAAGTIFDILASIGAVTAGAGDTEADEVHHP